MSETWMAVGGVFVAMVALAAALGVVFERDRARRRSTWLVAQFVARLLGLEVVEEIERVVTLAGGVDGRSVHIEVAPGGGLVRVTPTAPILPPGVQITDTHRMGYHIHEDRHGGAAAITGDDDFDKGFMVYTDEPEAVASSLSDAVRQALLDHRRPHMWVRPDTLELHFMWYRRDIDDLIRLADAFPDALDHLLRLADTLETIAES